MRFATAFALLAVAGLSPTPLFAQATDRSPPAQADTVDRSLPTQLPRVSVPSRYAISLAPDAKALTFDATVAIDLAVVKATRSLTLNAADLTIRSARLLGGDGASRPGSVRSDTAAQTVTIDFGSAVAPGAYRLDIVYAGRIATQANGLFALDYKNPRGRDQRALFTQFEPADARRLFPGWDEPDYKARFDLTVRVPATDMAVSNMPVAATRPLPGGLKEVRFATSPVMSSYLLFFGSGDFDRIARRVGKREVGIVVGRGNAAKARTALDAEAAILPWYEEYFGVDYPLPKLDNVAGPGQSQFFSAMENWGAIFSFERVLLDDPAITSDADRQHIFVVEAHEMAHQWFGDLVTMGWWGDLWLNEGFASWMESKTTQHFHPDWGADVDQVESRETAMALDVLPTSHPIVQDVRTVEQANQAFDDITYQKGESVIAMLEAFAGADVWRSGIRAYVRRHAYRNTTTADLWAAIEGAGATGLTRVADDFTRQRGVPLIRVADARCVDGRTLVTLSQEEFTADRRPEANARPAKWHVPVAARVGAASASLVTDGPANALTVAGCGPLRLNPGQAGYYRTLYTPAQLAALTAGFAALPAPDQYGEMSNAMALALAGYQPVPAALDVLDAVPVGGNGKVVAAALGTWVDLQDRFRTDSGLSQAIRSRAIARFLPRLLALGFDPRQREPATDATLRRSLIAGLGALGEPRTLGEARRLTLAWLKNRDAIPGTLKTTWLGVAAANADPVLWEHLRDAAVATPGTVERTRLFQLLGTARDPALARRTLDLALTDQPGKTISAGMIAAVATAYPGLALDTALTHLVRINALLDTTSRSRFVGGLADGSADEALIPPLQAYAAANLAAADRRSVDEAVAAIRTRAAVNRRTAPGLRSWLGRHGGG